MKTVEQIKDGVEPDVVYTHHKGDLNIDHQVVHKVVITAFRPCPGESVREILFLRFHLQRIGRFLMFQIVSLRITSLT